jgi:hypothetical protein
VLENYPTEGWQYWGTLAAIALLGFVGLLLMLTLQL